MRNKLPQIKIEKTPKKDRFTRIKELCVQPITDDRSLAVLRSVVLSDNLTSQNMLQLKLANYSNHSIKSAYLTIELYNDAGEVIAGSINVEFLDVDASPFANFGTKNLIAISTVPDNYFITSVKLVMEDRSVFEYGKEQIMYLPTPTLLSEKMPEVYQEFLSSRNDLCFVPADIGNGMKRCTCGAIIFDEGKCKNCDRTFREAISAASEGSLEIEYKKAEKFKAGVRNRELYARITGIALIVVAALGILSRLFGM